ncbi:MAG: hypothetical protein PVS3B3_23480 [Ktedonobacteraceae bacterium]
MFSVQCVMCWLDAFHSYAGHNDTVKQSCTDTTYPYSFIEQEYRAPTDTATGRHMRIGGTSHER